MSNERGYWSDAELKELSKPKELVFYSFGDVKVKVFEENKAHTEQTEALELTIRISNKNRERINLENGSSQKRQQKGAD